MVLVQAVAFLVDFPAVQEDSLGLLLATLFLKEIFPELVAPAVTIKPRAGRHFLGWEMVIQEGGQTPHLARATITAMLGQQIRRMMLFSGVQAVETPMATVVGHLLQSLEAEAALAIKANL